MEDHYYDMERVILFIQGWFAKNFFKHSSPDYLYSDFKKTDPDAEISACIDANASNYNAAATSQSYDHHIRDDQILQVR